MQKVIVPLVVAASLGVLGWVGYVFMRDVGKADSPLARQQSRGAPGSAGPQVGQVAPNIIGKDLDDKEFALKDYQGKVVVLDFWGFW